MTDASPKHARSAILVATLTFSDSRTAANDHSGRLLRELLAGAGFALAPHAIVREERALIRQAIAERCADEGIAAVITTGGTGVSPRDGTIEAVDPLLHKTLIGFGEAFRRLSWDEIGPRAILSRALAGVVGTTVVACLPGSSGAVRLGVEALLIPTLEHAVDTAQGRDTAHHHHKQHHHQVEPPGPRHSPEDET